MNQEAILRTILSLHFSPTSWRAELSAWLARSSERIDRKRIADTLRIETHTATKPAKDLGSA